MLIHLDLGTGEIGLEIGLSPHRALLHLHHQHHRPQSLDEKVYCSLCFTIFLTFCFVTADYTLRAASESILSVQYQPKKDCNRSRGPLSIVLCTLLHYSPSPALYSCLIVSDTLCVRKRHLVFLPSFHLLQPDITSWPRFSKLEPLSDEQIYLLSNLHIFESLVYF
jgi:hypothetical protein